MNRIVCVSNRVPASRKDAAGGLATGVLAAMRSAGGGLWFGWSGETCQAAEPGPATRSHREGIEFATIDLPDTLAGPYYDGFANGSLWPLFHYFIGRTHFSTAEYAAYRQVNALFARRIAPLITPMDLVWVHDYHLVPLAEHLRSAGVRAPLGLFLHIPFPHFEVLRALPVHDELMNLMLAYDLVGFQTEIDRRSFLSCAAGVWGAEAIDAEGTVSVGERRLATGVFPIGIDVDAVADCAAEAHAMETVQRMIRGLLGRRLVIGVDRLDYSKGLMERFAAYESFLERHEALHGRVTYLQIAPLSRTNVTAYVEIRNALERATGRINGRFADADWTPIRYLNRNFAHTAMMGFLRAADVGLVTPMRDGMNLVAKEFIAAQDPEDPGVLILSRLAGAAVELTDALLVNPFDTDGVAEAIHAALTMPRAERRSRHAHLLEALRVHDISAWHRNFIAALQRHRASRTSSARAAHSRRQLADPWIGAAR